MVANIAVDRLTTLLVSAATSSHVTSDGPVRGG